MIPLSRRLQIFIDSEASDKPQRVHSLPTPRCGGIGIFLSFALIALFFIQNDLPLFMGILIGGLVVFASGVIEDLRGTLSPKLRLALQCLGAIIFISVSGSYLQYLGFGISLPFWIAIPFSVFAIVGIINAINIIDGFNGLAGGISCIAFVCLSILLPSSSFLAPIIYALIGGVLGFLFFNFPKGKIFLGDGGAYFLGFVLATLLIYTTQTPLEETQKISPWFGIALLIYPFWEVIFSIYRRKIVRHLSPMQPDNLHIHTLIHKRRLRSNPKTSLFVCCFALPFMLSATFFATNTMFLFLQSCFFVVLYLCLYRSLIAFAIKIRS
ncbi:hypothetical protein BBW65_00165 [Helicobacter enhydrae]|uniref:Undecaprenyl/decaprenyl-phosphate alpha-N-acetylglucosaminyl 1-phosphate transferase n=2 Tax=Helicobacter enhydrae TaxID=222136 RepID=A0A1B1U7F1_9HELI|nr:hypothetical protein BBW65_00165 [Helicobacter enhydrae]